MSSENENPDSITSAPQNKELARPKMTQRSRRERSPFKKLLPLVFIAVIALTVYFYLDQNVFAPNRPLVWQSATAEKLENSFRRGKIIVAAVGQFDSKRDSRAFIDRVEVPVLRKEAHRLNSEFVVLKLEPEPGSDTPIRDLISEKTKIAANEISQEPFFLILYHKLKSPIQIENNTEAAEKIAEQLGIIRRGDYEK